LTRYPFCRRLNGPIRALIPNRLTPNETAREIKDQGGLVYLEHPYDQLRRHLTENAIEAVADLIDIVEVFNGRSDKEANRRAADLRDTLRAAPGAGSDAHTIHEIG
jgi:predicted metal-dependent phosphoesterase TrpH